MRQDDNDTESRREETRTRIWITIVGIVVAVLGFLYIMIEEQRLKEKYFPKGDIS